MDKYLILIKIINLDLDARQNANYFLRLNVTLKPDDPG
jgi:hypothetical protein